MMMKRLVLGALATLLAVAPLHQTLAYNLLKTSDNVELRWYQSVVPYYINIDDFSDFEPDDVIEVTQRCFDTWTSENIGVTFQFVDLTHTKDALDDQYNIIFFVQDPIQWQEMFNKQETALAMTRTWARPSGEILAFDLAFNDERYEFTNTEDPDQVLTDYANTLTHEIGHVLGLDHSENLEAVMYATSPRGELSKRYLSDDDREGLQYLYRPIEPGCAFTENPFSAEGSACRYGPPLRRRSNSVASLLILAIPAFVLRRRRSKFG